MRLPLTIGKGPFGVRWIDEIQPSGKGFHFVPLLAAVSYSKLQSNYRRRSARLAKIRANFDNKR